MTEMPSLNALLMPIMMICICAMNLIWNGRRTDGRTTLDATRLQAALTEELYLLAKLYRTNLELLDRAEVRLLSTRIPMAIFRANVPRLTLLDEDVVRCLVVHHSDFGVLIPSHSRIGKLSGGTRISMLLGTPGRRRMKPFRSRLTIIWWTEGGLTRKWRWMSASAGGRPNMWA